MTLHIKLDFLNKLLRFGLQGELDVSVSVHRLEIKVSAFLKGAQSLFVSHHKLKANTHS